VFEVSAEVKVEVNLNGNTQLEKKYLIVLPICWVLYLPIETSPVFSCSTNKIKFSLQICFNFQTFTCAPAVSNTNLTVNSLPIFDRLIKRV
jgi:hypothetical protein